MIENVNINYIFTEKYSMTGVKDPVHYNSLRQPRYVIPQQNVDACMLHTIGYNLGIPA